jgi:hypothetical protein
MNRHEWGIADKEVRLEIDRHELARVSRNCMDLEFFLVYKMRSAGIPYPTRNPSPYKGTLESYEDPTTGSLIIIWRPAGIESEEEALQNVHTPKV